MQMAGKSVPSLKRQEWKWRSHRRSWESRPFVCFLVGLAKTDWKR